MAPANATASSCRTDNPDVCPPKLASTFMGGGGIGAGTGQIAAKLPDTESEGSLEEPTKEVDPPSAAMALERDDSAHPTTLSSHKA